jgi:PPOX class probable F420-dependent enzyme
MTIFDENYVLLTTFRKNGQPTSRPVWIAPLGDGTGGFTTEERTLKVTHIRNNPKVTLQACGMRGNVRSGAPVVEATAEVRVGDDAVPVRDAVYRKYWVMSKGFVLSDWWRRVRRRPPVPPCVVHIRLA